jgi:hypothetical protein
MGPVKRDFKKTPHTKNILEKISERRTFRSINLDDNESESRRTFHGMKTFNDLKTALDKIGETFLMPNKYKLSDNIPATFVLYYSKPVLQSDTYDMDEDDMDGDDYNIDDDDYNTDDDDYNIGNSDYIKVIFEFLETNDNNSTQTLYKITKQINPRIYSANSLKFFATDIWDEYNKSNLKGALLVPIINVYIDTPQNQNIYIPVDKWSESLFDLNAETAYVNVIVKHTTVGPSFFQLVTNPNPNPNQDDFWGGQKRKIKVTKQSKLTKRRRFIKRSRLTKRKRSRLTKRRK